MRAIGNYGVGILPSRNVFFTCKEIKYEMLRDKIINSASGFIGNDAMKRQSSI